MFLRGELIAFDNGTWTATVRLWTSAAVVLSGIPVAHHIPAAQLTAGAQVVVLVFDQTNPTDAVVIATYTGVANPTVVTDDHDHDGDYVNTGGDTMTGALSLPANGLTVGTNQLAVSGGDIGFGTASPATVQGATLPGLTVNLDNGTSRGDYVVRGNPANVNLINASGAADDKWLQFNVTSTGIARFRSLKDDNTAAVKDNIIVLDMDTGRIGFNDNAPAGHVQITVHAASAIGQIIKAAASPSAHLQEWQNSSGTVLMSVSENGYLKIRKTAAPADGELDNNDLAMWWDEANGKVKWKAKDNGGTVKTGELALA